jgi:hypothetical protein
MFLSHKDDFETPLGQTSGFDPTMNHIVRGIISPHGI